MQKNKERKVTVKSSTQTATVSQDTTRVDNTTTPQTYTVQKGDCLWSIAKKFYGSAQYSWIISYMNRIEDGFTVYTGQRIMILDNFTDLFSRGEILAAIPAMTLNLGSE